MDLDKSTLLIEPHAHQARTLTRTRMECPHVEAQIRPGAWTKNLHRIIHVHGGAEHLVVEVLSKCRLAQLTGMETFREGGAFLGSSPQARGGDNTLVVAGVAGRLVPALPRSGASLEIIRLPILPLVLATRRCGVPDGFLRCCFPRVPTTLSGLSPPEPPRANPREHPIEDHDNQQDPAGGQFMPE